MPSRTLSTPALSSGSHRDERLWEDYAATNRLAVGGEWQAATQQLAALAGRLLEPALAARVHNDLGVLAVLSSDLTSAREAFRQAIALQPEWMTPQQNVARLRRGTLSKTGRPTGSSVRPAGNTRIAIVSLLFNWPSTGGGTVHTAETARFLSRLGYDVRHFVVRFAGWSIGAVSESVDWPVEFLDFTEETWQRPRIQQRVREAVVRFQPDHVILTDSWNFKPRLAEAVEGFSCFLRLAAQEGLCPLNNVRLLQDGPDGWRCCPQQQLARPDQCRACIQERGATSGPLHKAERALAGFDEPDYERSLRWAFARAAGVLVVNPLIAESVKPFAQAVHVIPSGFDPAWFPAPVPPSPDPQRRVRLLFAGLVNEPMKGFDVLLAGCQRLWFSAARFPTLGHIGTDRTCAGIFGVRRLAISGQSARVDPVLRHRRLPHGGGRSAWAHGGGGDGSRPTGRRQPDRGTALHRPRRGDRSAVYARRSRGPRPATGTVAG